MMPSGKVLMEDFYTPAGLRPGMRELGENHLLHKDSDKRQQASDLENNKARAVFWGRIREVINRPQVAVKDKMRNRR